MLKESKKFAEYLRCRRQELDLTQEQVAKKLQVSQNFVAYLEKGERKPTNQMIKKISQVLLLPTDKLYFLANPDVTNMVEFDEVKGVVKQKIPPALEELREDKELRSQNHITNEEIEQLASMRLRGEVRSKEDYLFLLLSIRQILR